MSKKLLMAIAGVVSVALGEFLGVPEEASMQILAIVVSYILGQGIADLGKEAKKIEKK